MNTGIISSRYAKALLDYVDIRGSADAVLLQVVAMEKALAAVEELRQVIDDTITVSPSTKLKLLDSVISGEMEPDLKKFLKLVFVKGRGSCLKFMLRDFVEMYYRERKIIFAKLVTTAESPELEDILKKKVKEATGFDLRIETVINPDLIGGFVFTIKDIRIDASVVRQIETLKEQFIKKNRRIV